MEFLKSFLQVRRFKSVLALFAFLISTAVFAIPCSSGVRYFSSETWYTCVILANDGSHVSYPYAKCSFGFSICINECCNSFAHNF